MFHSVSTHNKYYTHTSRKNYIFNTKVQQYLDYEESGIHNFEKRVQIKDRIKDKKQLLFETSLTNSRVRIKYYIDTNSVGDYKIHRDIDGIVEHDDRDVFLNDIQNDIQNDDIYNENEEDIISFDNAQQILGGAVERKLSRLKKNLVKNTITINQLISKSKLLYKSDCLDNLNKEINSSEKRKTNSNVQITIKFDNPHISKTMSTTTLNPFLSIKNGFNNGTSQLRFVGKTIVFPDYTTIIKTPTQLQLREMYIPIKLELVRLNMTSKTDPLFTHCPKSIQNVEIQYNNNPITVFRNNIEYPFVLVPVNYPNLVFEGLNMQKRTWDKYFRYLTFSDAKELYNISSKKKGK
jgi:hypothetical protein